MEADAFAIFSVDENGNPSGMREMKPIRRRVDFSFDFQDLDFKTVN